MKKLWNSYQVALLALIIIPMFLFISFFYYDKQQAYESHIKTYERNMATILLEEKTFIGKILNSDPLILNENMALIENQFLVGEHPAGVENLLLKYAMDRLECGSFGIYSLDKNQVVFHLGMEEIYRELDTQYLIEQIAKEEGDFFINFRSSYLYIVPINNGFIYTYQDNINNKPNPEVFIGMIIIAIILGILGAKWVENRTNNRINILRNELYELKEKGNPLPKYNDKFSEIVNSVNDLKEHLSSQKETLHYILDNIPIGIIYYDSNGQIVYANKTSQQITGYSKEEIKGFTVSSKVLSSNETLFWETLRSGQTFLGFESYCPTKEGREIPVMTTTQPLYSENEFLGTISSFFDISEQERLRKIEQRASVMLDHISDGVMMVDKQGVITGFNHGAEVMTGLKSEQVLGKKYDDIFIKRKTIFTKLTQTLETQMEYTNYKKETVTEDGRKVYLMITTKVLWDTQGQKLGALGIYKDITHVEELSQQIQRADKLAVVGELAAGTAHEIRNPLTTIKGFIQLLKVELKETDKEGYINLVLDEINHINEIIKEMLLLAKPTNPSRSFTSINQSVRDIVSFMNSEAMLFNIEFDISLDKEIPEIEIDERQIKQVFINLIRNSIQAMKKGGLIKVHTKLDQLNDNVEIIFEDNGEGIEENQLAKIYEPFFTTKEDGTGLGIPVSYQIMKNHKGDLQIYSTVGKGTKVILKFPLTVDESAEDW